MTNESNKYQSDGRAHGEAVDLINYLKGNSTAPMVIPGAIDEALADLFDSAQNDKISQDAFIRRVLALFATDTPAKYLVVAMDDDGNGNPHYCADEAAVEEVVTNLMFSDPGDYEKETGKLHAADLIEEGFINFEGDPGIHLYRLADGTVKGEPSRGQS